MGIEDRPAHNAEAEEGFLGSLLIDIDILTMTFPPLDEDDFFLEQHQQIYRAIRLLAGSGRPVDPAAIVGELTRAGSPGSADLSRSIDRISESVPHAANGPYYAEIIRAKRIERDIMSCHERARGPAREG